MTELKIVLQPDEFAALEAGRKQHGRIYTAEMFARLLIRDELIRMGLLGLPRENRSKGARR